MSDGFALIYGPLTSQKLRPKNKRLYCDTEGFSCDNKEIDARAFTSGNKMAIVATQSHLTEATTSGLLLNDIFLYIHAIRIMHQNQNGHSPTHAIIFHKTLFQVLALRFYHGMILISGAWDRISC